VRQRARERRAAHHLVGEVERELALQRVGQNPLERRALENLCDEPLRVVGLADGDDIRFELSPRQRLDHDPLDDPMLDERTRDGLGQRSCKDTVDHLFRLGRREHVLGHALEPAARINPGVSARLGEPFSATTKRRGEG